MRSATQSVGEDTGHVQLLTIPRWFDRHLHIREGTMLETVLPCTIDQHATGALIMGNLKKPITSFERALEYKKEITTAIKNYASRNGRWRGGDESDFKPRLALYLTDDISPEEVLRGFKAGLWQAVKLYMANQNGEGGTTGSAHGVRNLLGRYPVFKVMEKYQIPLLGHFEAVEEDVDEFDRELVSFERDCLPLVKAFPGMPIVVEHITDGYVAEIIAENKINLFATVTAHHLMINRNAMFRGGMNPLYYCKPVPKKEHDRLIIRALVASGNPRFGAGTDSAPHDESAKARCCGCAAGIFTAPTAVEMYTTVFDEVNALQHLGAFLSENFIALYGMEVSKATMTLERKPMKVPEKLGSVHVFKGGQELPWTLVG